MKLSFSLYALIFLFLLGSMKVFGGTTCANPGNYAGAVRSCDSDPTIGFIQPSYWTGFPTGTKVLTLLLVIYFISDTDTGCGGGFPYELFRLTVEYGGVRYDVISLNHKSLSEFSYSVRGVEYYSKNVGSGVNAFPHLQRTMIQASIDLVNNRVSMATTFAGGADFYAPLPPAGSFSFDPNWSFSGSTKFWFGGGPGTTSRYYMGVDNIWAWNGFIESPGTSGLTGGLLMGYSTTLIRWYKLGNEFGPSLWNSFGGDATAILGGSVTSPPDTMKSPIWATTRSILKFTATDQYLVLPRFEPSAPNTAIKASASVTFWIRLNLGSDSGYVFRFSTGNLLNDRVALKWTAGKLQACAGPSSSASSCQTPFSATGVGSLVWSQITLNWAYIYVPSATTLNFLSSVYANGKLINVGQINGRDSSLITYSATDMIRFGGFTGLLGPIRVHNPGSFQVNDPTWCTSTTCGMDIGVMNPLVCIGPISCDSSCSVCSSIYSDGCVACAAGKGFYDGECGSCPLKTVLIDSDCEDCPDNCDVCSDASTCTTCSDSYYLYNGECVGSCSPGSYKAGNSCLDCLEGCDACVDGSTCTKCNSAYYSFGKSCVKNCPLTTYSIEGNCLSCPQNCDVCLDANTCSKCSPGFSLSSDPSKNICSSEGPESSIILTQPAKINKVAESTANTVLVTRNIAAPSASSPMMFGSLTKLIQYFRHLNVSRSDRLESVFLADEDSGNYIPMPTMSKRMKGAFERKTVPFVFDKYGVSSNFLINQGDNLLAIVTIFGVFIVVLLLQQGFLFIRNIPLLRFFIIKSRFFFQNYFLSRFYEILGDVVFCAVLELKTLSLDDKYALVSFLVCCFCLILGATLFVMNIWIVNEYQKKKNLHSEVESQKKALEKFAEKYKGVEILFNDFEDTTFTHQAVLIFFIGRNILFCLVIVLFYETPIFQCFLLLILDLSIVGYYLYKRSIKARLDYFEQLIYELLLLTANVCFFVMALAEGSESEEKVITTLSEVIIVINIACKFLALGFMIFRIAVTAWEYFKQLREIIRLLRKKETKKVTPMTVTLDSARPFHLTEQDNSSRTLENSHSINLEQNNGDQSVAIPTRRRYLLRIPKVSVIPEEDSFVLDRSSEFYRPNVVPLYKNDMIIKDQTSMNSGELTLTDVIECQQVIKIKRRRVKNQSNHQNQNQEHENDHEK